LSGDCVNEEVELTQALIRNACVNDGRDPTSEIPNADLVVATLEGSGFDIEVFDAAPGRRSVVARLAGSNPEAPALMFLGHTDVVPVSVERWRHDPFGGEVIDDELWGRGALDMLGHVSTMCLAARDHARAGRHRGGDLVVAMVADEEALGSFGMGWLVDNQRDAVRADWVVTESGGLPSGTADSPVLSVMSHEKGAWRARLRVLGALGHSAMPFGSVNALTVAAEVIVRIGAHESNRVITEPWKAFVEAGWYPEPGTPLLDPERIDHTLGLLANFPAKVAHALTRMTMVTTSVSGSFSWNTIPGEVSIEVDIRTLPGQDLPEIEAELAKVLGPLRSDVSIEIIAGMPSNGSPPDTQLWQLLQAASSVQRPGARLIPTLSAGVTDARFMRKLGAQAYGFGMYSDKARISEIPLMLHGDNERVDLASLQMMRCLWDDVLAGFCERTSTHNS
jgi:acetylornithine deacetylase/succinyl-diaminopimelate desuccinylase-like protein